MSNRASPRGKSKLGPEAWCDIWIFLFVRSLATDLADVVSQTVFYIARLVKALLHQLFDSVLRGRPHDRGKGHIPLRCDFVVRWQTRHVDKALCFADRALVERRDPAG